MKKAVLLLLSLLLTLCAACGGGTAPAAEPPAGQQTDAVQETEEPRPEDDRDDDGEETSVEKVLKLTINDVEVAVAWEDNDSVRALAELAAAGELTVQMSMYGGFEQVGPIGSRLPSSDVQTTTSAGDIVLYAGDRIVVFYGSNSWAYTRLGHITDRDAAGMAELLGNGNVTITISMEDAA